MMMIKITTIITCMFLTMTACHKKNAAVNSESKKELSLFASHAAKPIIVRVQDDESSKFMKMTLKYSGKSDFAENLEKESDSVQNLIISVLSDYELRELRTDKGKVKFQQNILTSLNEFVAENKFVGVELVGLKEI